MDNNFDENKPVSDNAFSEESFSETAPAEPAPMNQPEQDHAPENQPEQNIPAANMFPNPGQNSVPASNMPPNPEQNIPAANMPPHPENFQQPAYGFPNGGIPNYPQYVPGFPGQGGMYPPPQTPEKKKLSGGCLWALIAAIIVLVGISVLLAFMIASQLSSRNALKEKENSFPVFTDKEPAEQVIIEIPTYRKPVLEEELYQNPETGLLTTIGVAKMVLPSQVKIEIFGDIPYAPIGSGSGIIISSDGYIVTNAHVVDGAEHLSVKFYDDSSEEAVLIGMDRKSDLAVVKVSRNDLSPAEIGTSADLVIGEEIALAGAGGGFENTVTYGHVTGLDREINTSYISSSSLHCIQTDAALNPGNSGGALVNMYGQVVGVAVALMNHETYENIGFSIAIDDAVPIIEELIANGYVSSRSRVGISYLTIGDSMAGSYEVMPGLCVTEIDPGSNVANTDITLYDIIIQIDDVRVFGSEEVAEALEGKGPGDTVRLTVFRRSVTGENSIFEVPIELIPDTGSVSGYSESISSEDFFGRDIISNY